jgi:metallo-beta-lactamase class B
LRITTRRWLFGLTGAVVLAGFFLGRWMNATKIAGQEPAEPFRIAGNFYYVGANDIAAFLITGPAGHIVLDAGYPTTAPMIMASDASADTIASGGDDPDLFLPVRALIWSGLLGYPATRVDHRFKDGDVIRLGPIALTAHITAGHTRGCTSYSFSVRDGDRVLNVVSVCDTGVLGMSRYPEQAADRERSLRVFRSLPVDIWVTNHARAWGRYRKFVASATAKNPVDPFIDPEGYRAYIDTAESELRRGLVH